MKIFQARKQETFLVRWGKQFHVRWENNKQCLNNKACLASTFDTRKKRKTFFRKKKLDDESFHKKIFYFHVLAFFSQGTTTKSHNFFKHTTKSNTDRERMNPERKFVNFVASFWVKFKIIFQTGLGKVESKHTRYSIKTKLANALRNKRKNFCLKIIFWFKFLKISFLCFVRGSLENFLSRELKVRNPKSERREEEFKTFLLLFNERQTEKRKNFEEFASNYEQNYSHKLFCLIHMK